MTFPLSVKFGTTKRWWYNAPTMENDRQNGQIGLDERMEEISKIEGRPTGKRSIRSFGQEEDRMPHAANASSQQEDEGMLESVPAHLREIGRIPLLPAEEEVRLAKEIEAGVQASAWLEEKQVKIQKPQSPAEAFDEARKNPHIIFDAVDETISKNTYDEVIQKQIQIVQRADAARKTLHEANYRLVVSIARRYTNRGREHGTAKSCG